MTEFCHISPTSLLEVCAKTRSHHLVLAHLVETSKEYVNWYVKNRSISDTIIMDNSAFEMYKAGLPMYPPAKLIEMGRKVQADYIVLPDYPDTKSINTIIAAEEYAPVFKDNGFGTFFVPQSEIGDIEDLIESVIWAVENPIIDYIGISILAVPNAYGVEKNNKLQRFLSRWKFMGELNERGIIDLIHENNKKVHFLGMVDGPNEIQLLKEYLSTINTWDSSAAVWAGLNGIEFDDSPTGLIDGKYESEVDFNYVPKNKDRIQMALNNMNYIDEMLEKYDGRINF